jgi:hypothetical protein
MEDNTDAIDPGPTPLVGRPARCNKHLLPAYSCDCWPVAGRPRKARAVAEASPRGAEPKVNRFYEPLPPPTPAPRYERIANDWKRIGDRAKAQGTRSLDQYGNPDTGRGETVVFDGKPMSRKPWRLYPRFRPGLGAAFRPAEQAAIYAFIAAGKVTHLPAKHEMLRPWKHKRKTTGVPQFRWPRYIRPEEDYDPEFTAQKIPPLWRLKKKNNSQESANSEGADAPDMANSTIYSRGVYADWQDALPPIPKEPDDKKGDKWLARKDRPQAGRKRGRPRAAGKRTPAGQLSRAARDLGTDLVQEKRRQLVSCPDCGTIHGDPTRAADGAPGLLREHGLIDDRQYSGAREYAKAYAIRLAGTVPIGPRMSLAEKGGGGWPSNRKLVYWNKRYAAMCTAITAECLRQVHRLAVDDNVPEWAVAVITGAENSEAAGIEMEELCQGLDVLAALPHGARSRVVEDNPGPPSPVAIGRPVPVSARSTSFL